MISITGQPVDPNSYPYQMIVSALKGYEKPIEKIDPNDFANDFIYQRIVDLELKEEEISKLQEAHIQKTTNFNIDVECEFNKEFIPEKSLFKSLKYHDYFAKYFEANCASKNYCDIDINRMSITEEKIDFNDYD